jgi:hypothetical protein
LLQALITPNCSPGLAANVPLTSAPSPPFPPRALSPVPPWAPTATAWILATPAWDGIGLDVATTAVEDAGGRHRLGWPDWRDDH